MFARQGQGHRDLPLQPSFFASSPDPSSLTPPPPASDFNIAKAQIKDDIGKFGDSITQIDAKIEREVAARKAALDNEVRPATGSYAHV